MNIKVYDIKDGTRVKTSDDILEMSEEQGGKDNNFFTEKDEKFFIPEVKDIYKINLIEERNVVVSNIVCVNEDTKKLKEQMDKTTSFLNDLKKIGNNIDTNENNVLNIMNREVEKANNNMVDLARKIYDTFCNMYEGVVIDGKLTLRKGVAHEYKHRRNIPVATLFRLIAENKEQIRRKMNRDNAVLFEYLADLIVEFKLEKQADYYTQYYNDNVKNIINKLGEENKITIELKNPFYYYYATRYDTIENKVLKSVSISGINIDYFEEEDSRMNNGDVPNHIRKFIFDTIPEIKIAIDSTINMLKNLNNKLEVHNNHMDKFCSKHLVLAGLCREEDKYSRRSYGGFSDKKYENIYD
jgi:hypothetical protein